MLPGVPGFANLANLDWGYCVTWSVVVFHVIGINGSVVISTYNLWELGNAFKLAPYLKSVQSSGGCPLPGPPLITSEEL